MTEEAKNNIGEILSDLGTHAAPHFVDDKSIRNAVHQSGIKTSKVNSFAKGNLQDILENTTNIKPKARPNRDVRLHLTHTLKPVAKVTAGPDRKKNVTLGKGRHSTIYTNAQHTKGKRVDLFGTIYPDTPSQDITTFEASDTDKAVNAIMSRNQWKNH